MHWAEAGWAWGSLGGRTDTAGLRLETQRLGPLLTMEECSTVVASEP